MNKSEKKKILFVDDEQKVLDGIRRMMHRNRERWDMHFVSSAKEGLEVLQTVAFDVVISDMRMPEMDGGEFLAQVKKDYPHIACIILSGYSDQDMILRTVTSADQFLSKPCDSKVLEQIIVDALKSHEVVSEKKMRAMATRMKYLPTLPSLYLKLKELLLSSKSSFGEIADIIAKDITMSAKILQLVNSAFFGLRHKVSNVRQALVYLGTETIKAVILTSDVFGQITEEQDQKFGITQLYHHSFFVGGLNRILIQPYVHTNEALDEASTSGILHDIGKIMLILNHEKEYLDVVQKHMRDNIPLHFLEYERFGLSHAEMGGYLIGLWGLPKVIVDAVTYHHLPLKAKGLTVNATAITYSANILYHQEHDQPGMMFSQVFLDKLKLNETMEAWQQATRDMKNNQEKGQSRITNDEESS